MKKYLMVIAVVALIMSSCTDQQFSDEIADLTRASAQVSEIDIQKEQAPTPCNDEALEATVCQMLQENMTKRDCKTGTVYVVETCTGRIKACVSLMRKGDSFMPYEDTYTEEQSNMLFGPTYLALLSSGKVTPYAMIDTEFGIYKDVRDHNWRRGGYGVLTLEKALGCQSIVTFTKAKEMVYGNDHAAYNQKISSYLGTTPKHALGILTFYNAVANGGRMVKLMTEGDDVIVLNDQIAAPENIATLQQGLLRAVSRGLFLRAGRNYTDVAACGRTFQTDKKTRRMELCGYFPADNPIYTIMVVLEKNGLPAGAGSMCGSIMASTIDILTDFYNLHYVVVPSTESFDEQDVVVVDTIAAQ